MASSSYRSLELTLIAAHDLKNVNIFTPMQVYAAVALTGDPRSRQRTPPDRSGGRNPNWNSTVRLNVPVDGDLSRAALHILLRTERTLGDRDVGEVFVPITDILDGPSDGPTASHFRSYQVRKVTSGRPKGVIDLSFKLGERIGVPAPARPPAMTAPYPPQSWQSSLPSNSSKNEEPVLAYPVGAPSSAAAPYPPAGGYSKPAPAYGYAQGSQQGHGYGYPAPAVQGQQGYGYGYQQPAPQGGYGYGYGYGGQVVQPQRKKNNFGMGLGAGLLGGALGGLLIGDMISDASSYDAGYDAGFDAGGFDF